MDKIYRACEDVQTVQEVESMGMGLAVGMKFKTLDSYSLTFQTDSVLSKQDAIDKLKNMVDGYCSQAGVQKCIRGNVEIKTVGKVRLFVEGVLDFIFSGYSQVR